MIAATPTSTFISMGIGVLALLMATLIAAGGSMENNTNLRGKFNDEFYFATKFRYFLSALGSKFSGEVFNIAAKSTDDFICDCIDLDELRAMEKY